MNVSFYVYQVNGEFQRVGASLIAESERELVLDGISQKRVRAEHEITELTLYRNDICLILFACLEDSVLRPIYCRDDPLAREFQDNPHIIEDAQYQALLQEVTAEISKTMILAKPQMLKELAC